MPLKRAPAGGRGEPVTLPAPPADGARVEAARQLAAAAERHREAVAASQALGRSEAGQTVAVKVVGRAVHLVSFALTRADEAGIEFERLVELTGWEPEQVRAGLEPPVAGALTPDGVDAAAVARAAAAFDAISRLHELTRRVLADVDIDVEAETPAPLAPADLEALHDQLEAAWQSWRAGLNPRPAP